MTQTQNDFPLNQVPPPETTPWDPVIQKHIKQLIAEIHKKDKPFENEDVVTEIVVTALKAVQSQVGRGELKLLSRALRELRYAFKIFKGYRTVRKITMFGSARTKPSDPDYKLAKAFAKKLTDRGYMVITGAGPGIMEAGNEGAGPSKSFGVNIRLPFEQHANRFIDKQSTYIDCRYFFTRKLVFVKEAAGTIFFPGGFGTLDEAFEVLTLVQTGKCDPIPIIFMDNPKGTFWKGMNSLIRSKLLGGKKISPEDLHLYKITTNVDDAVDEIFKFYSNFHSMRYIGKDLVFRLKHPIDKKTLDHLNNNFTDILVSGKYTSSEPLKEEENQPELKNFSRLVFKFNRINNGRLRQLIDYLNTR